MPRLTWGLRGGVVVFVNAILLGLAALVLGPRDRVVAASNTVDFRELSAGDAQEQLARCIRVAPQKLTESQRQQLCRQSSTFDEGPAHCAKAAMGSFPMSLTQATVDRIIALCGRAEGSGPGECWAALPVSMRTKPAAWGDLLLQLCREATDTQPADCLLMLKHHSPTGFISTKNSAIATGVEVCRRFAGSISALDTCMRQSPRRLGFEDRLLLCHRCRHEDLVPLVTDCARHLLQRAVAQDVAVGTCASIVSQVIHPHECVMAAQQQLRWMEPMAVTYLCEFSTSSQGPVDCALALRSWYTAAYHQPPPPPTGKHRHHHHHRRSSRKSHSELARLCQRATPAVVDCVRSLPSALPFTADQVIKICAVVHEPGGAVVPEDTHLNIAGCLVHGHRVLFTTSRAVHLPEEKLRLLLQLCIGPVRSAVPAECVEASNGIDLPSVSRVSLCKGATTTIPRRCYQSLRPQVVHALGRDGAIRLCAGAESLAPAECANRLVVTEGDEFLKVYGWEFCSEALTEASMACYHAASRSFDNVERAKLCHRATSIMPTVCAAITVSRLPRNMDRALLCSQAISTAPAHCANAAPFGLKIHELLALCWRAESTDPAQCARAVPATMRIPWRSVILVCNGARGTTPANCLVRRVRRRESLTHQAIAECRAMHSVPTATEIAKFAYECRQLVPRCPILMTVQVLDQFGDPMPTLNRGHVQVIVTPATGEATPDPRILHGETVARVVNGTADFRGFTFTRAGNFTLHLRGPGLEDSVARIQIHANATEQALEARCRWLLAEMQCPKHTGPPTPPPLATGGDPAEQILQLPHAQAFGGGDCEDYWRDLHWGLQHQATTPYHHIYSIPAMAYRLLTGDSVPTAQMSSWDCLGLPEGANRSAIRRAYHQRSLEWHPDKWGHHTAASPELREKVEATYTLITRAYEELFNLQPQSQLPN